MFISSGIPVATHMKAVPGMHHNDPTRRDISLERRHALIRAVIIEDNEEIKAHACVELDPLDEVRGLIP